MTAPKGPKGTLGLLARTATKAASAPRPSTLLRFTYEPLPKPVNCTTLTSTRDILANRSHPLYERTQRKIAAFDPKKLHMAVRVPLTVCKKATLRVRMKRTVRDMMHKALKEQGWRSDGTVKGGMDSKHPALCGALCLAVSGFVDVKTPEHRELKAACDDLVAKVALLQSHRRAHRGFADLEIHTGPSGPPNRHLKLDKRESAEVTTRRLELDKPKSAEFTNRGPRLEKSESFEDKT